MGLKEIRKKPLSMQERIDLSTTLASNLLKDALAARTRKEKRHEMWLAKMMSDKHGRAFMTEMSDYCFRSNNSARVIDQLIDLINRDGIPRFLDDADRFALLMLKFFGRYLPKVCLFCMKKAIRKKFDAVLLPKKGLHIENVTVNLNHLGEAILGENEAKKRLEIYLNDLANPSISYISVKVSTLYSQINLYAFDETVEIIAKRLRMLYQACSPQQFVNLDMEGYRDLDLTLAVFKKVLSEPQFHQLRAGIVLQAYLPESYSILQELTYWAVKRAGAPIKIRIVKGANLEMEKIESSMTGWAKAPFDKKEQSDANFKRMLQFAIDAKHTQYVHIAVASHNIFDIAYALVLREQTQTKQQVSFEMLRGMSPGLQRTLLKLTGHLTLYCPETSEHNFHNAIPYLIRRLDENGGGDNFLRHFYELTPNSSAWQNEQERFKRSCKLISSLPCERRRRTAVSLPFEPNTDFSLPENRLWKAEKKTLPPLTQNSNIDALFDMAELNTASLEKAPPLFSAARHELIELAVNEVGKPVIEADAEVSEAIDFLTYYQKIWQTRGKPKGVVLVASPWNFPIAIATSGIAAALITGNSVIFKPAPEAIHIGKKLAELFWEAGISKSALQFLCCNDEPEGSYLVQHPKLAAAILTGATDTARLFKRLRPNLHLIAETGGKNSMIVTAMADHDLAISDVVTSAFSFAGQKCSACSLLILEKELYNDPIFLEQLKDAATSLPVGKSSNPTTVIPPLIHSLNPGFLRLERGESWLVAPTNIEGNLWTAGIKLGVKRGGFTHQTEFFAPILGVMCAENLEDAISIANATPYGLTAGIHTLDQRERELWLKKIVAGNLYINRNIVGAIVERQPFGGCKASCFGPGAKVGGPNYLKQLVTIEDCEDGKKSALPPSILPLLQKFQFSEHEMRCAQSYAYWKNFYCTPKDVCHILGEQNLFYCVPKKHIIVRYRKEIELRKVLLALEICGTPYTLSNEESVDEQTFLDQMDTTTIRLLYPSDAIHQKAAETGAYIIDQPVYFSGEFEILHYLREISLSFDYHRYGYVTAQPNTASSSRPS